MSHFSQKYKKDHPNFLLFDKNLVRVENFTIYSHTKKGRFLKTTQ